MSRLAILGSYPEGAESSDYSTFPGMWSPWKRKADSKYAVWKNAEAELRPLLSRGVKVYVHFGSGAPISLVLTIDDIVIDERMIGPPGPTYADFRKETSHVWIRYKGAKELKPAIDWRTLSELVQVDGKFTLERPIGEAAWSQMYRTGLFFIKDPR